MSIEAPTAPPQKINLRRPDIMAAVKAQVLSHYRSALVERIRANGHILSAGDLTIKFGEEICFLLGGWSGRLIWLTPRGGPIPTGGYFCSAKSFIILK